MNSELLVKHMNQRGVAHRIGPTYKRGMNFELEMVFPVRIGKTGKRE